MHGYGMNITETPRIAKDESFGIVTTTHVEPTPQDELQAVAEQRRTEEIQYALYRKDSYMDFLQETDHSYRENSGAEPLDITLADGNWGELFQILRRKPKRFFAVPTEVFVGTTASGETRTPSIPTIQKTVDAEAWRQGMILGYASVDSDKMRSVKVRDDSGNVTGTKQVPVPRDDIFRLCYRPNVTKVPKRVARLGLDVDDFGIAREEQ